MRFLDDNLLLLLKSMRTYLDVRQQSKIQGVYDMLMGSIENYEATKNMEDARRIAMDSVKKNMYKNLKKVSIKIRYK